MYGHKALLYFMTIIPQIFKHASHGAMSWNIQTCERFV